MFTKRKWLPEPGDTLTVTTEEYAALLRREAELEEEKRQIGMDMEMCNSAYRRQELDLEDLRERNADLWRKNADLRKKVKRQAETIKTLKLVHKDWLGQQAVMKKLRSALKPFAEWATCGAVWKVDEGWDEKELNRLREYPGDLVLELSVVVEDERHAQVKTEIFHTAARVYKETEPNPNGGDVE